MKFLHILLFCFLIYIRFSNVISLRILGLFPYQGKSHFYVFKVYLEELARRGHDVTVVSHFPDPKTQYKDISLAGTVKILEDDIPLERSYATLVMLGWFLTTAVADNCEKMLELEAVQKLWKTPEKFDVIVTEQFIGDCSLGVAHRLGAPVVTLTSHTLLPFHYERVGIPDNVAFVPFLFLGGGSRPTFYQRIEVVIFRAYFNFMQKYITQRSDRKNLEKHFGDMPDMQDLIKDVKFTLLYQYPALTGSRLYPANIIEVGGYHVAPAKPLTGELKKFIDEAPHGVVYVSFGSLVKTSSVSADKLAAIIGALSQLKQRVIWKWESETLPGKPANILVKSWLPQNDILAHPKVVAFFSHGGMLSTSEAMHHGVPMVVMPILGDQPSNAAAIRESGLGLYLEIANLSTENLLANINQVLRQGSGNFELKNEPRGQSATILDNDELKAIVEADPAQSTFELAAGFGVSVKTTLKHMRQIGKIKRLDMFREQVKELSRLWHDRPLSPLDTAVFWTEFAARHPDYSLLSHAAGVPCYKYYSLDLLALLALFLFALFSATWWCCCRRRKTVADVSVKTKKRSKKD